MPNSRTEAGSGDPNQVDPNAWGEAAQDTDGEATEQGSREDAPEGFESEIEAYRRLLAQRERQQQPTENEAEENE